MELIIGGAYQGKLAYGRDLYPGLVWTDGESCTWEEAMKAEGLYHLEALIRREMKEGKALEDFAEKLCAAGNCRAVIACEVGSGIVPAEVFEREFRERTGRILVELAARSARVYRVVCGIGTVIKDA